MQEIVTSARHKLCPPARSVGGRALMRLLENSTGRVSLLRRAKGYQNDLAAGHGFFDAMARRCGLSLHVMRGSLQNIPVSGPAILIAKHLYGILDGVMLGHILTQTRPDFRIMANSIFSRAPGLTRYLLPINLGEDRDALAVNLATRHRALIYLEGGGAIGILWAAQSALRCSRSRNRWFRGDAVSPRGGSPNPTRRSCRSTLTGTPAYCSKSQAICMPICGWGC